MGILRAMALHFRAFSFCLMALALSSCSQGQKKISQAERASLHLQMGSGFLAQGNLPAAMSEFSMAEQLDPKNPVVQNNLGLVYQLRDRPKEAEAKFRRALVLEPTYTDVRTNLARLYIDNGRLADAIKELKIVENDLTYPAPEKVLTLSGMAHFKTKAWDQAEAKLTKALQIERTSCLAAVFLGRTYYEQSKMGAAAQVLDQAVTNCKGTKFEDPLFYSAMAYYSTGQREQSRARVEELLQKYPNGKFAAKGQAMLKLLE